MTFEELVDQALAMLQRRGRVTYRALQLQFKLDDATLEALKEELLFSQSEVVDEGGRGLVWVGGAQPLAPQETLLPVVAPPPEPSAPGAERRQLTVMFCDLVDSTRLSGQLDPEDYREVVQAYQAAAAEVIRRFEGHIAQYLGDGLLVYVGYPQAHEDDAQRAVHTGLEIVGAIRTLNTRLERDKGVHLAVRVGIHTGLVVVGEVGSGGRQEQLALGETPNIAARIQSLAAPDAVAISVATQRLVQDYFTCEDLGTHVLKGVAAPQQVYRVLGVSGAQTRLDIAVTRGLTPLVGRDSEVTMLLERWTQAKEGLGQVVVLSGEAGIGKSRLVQMLKEHLASEPYTRWECRTSPYYQNTALYPVTDLYERIWQFGRDDTPDAKLAKVEQALRHSRLPLAETVPLFAVLLSLSLPENRYPPLTLSPQRQRQKTLEALLTLVLEQTERQPVLCIIEDVHWIDPTTLELLGLLVDQVPTARLLTLLTCRPTFQPPWERRSYVIQVTLSLLTPPQVERIAEQVAGGKALPAEILRQLVAKADGVPLFVEEMTKAVMESGLLKETDGCYELTGPLPALAIPATLHDSLMARLDRLGAAKGVVQLGSTIGRQFAHEVLQAVSPLDEATLQRELGRLIEGELVYQRGIPPQATYTFKHALIQDAAYQSLLRSTRQLYHQRIAEVLESRFPETVEMQPELLAQHYTEAGRHGQAVAYWQRAGQRAMQRSAYAEAVSHLTKGLEVLAVLPHTPERAQYELNLQTTLGQALIATRGQASPEVERTYARALELCRQAGETQQLFPVLCGLWIFYLARAEFQTAQELGERLLALSQRTHDPALLLAAHRALGTTLFWRGELIPARAHMEQGIALYDPQQYRSLALLYGEDLGVACLQYVTWALLWLGYPDQALQRHHEALILARELSHPFSLVRTLSSAAMFYQYRREAQTSREQAEAAITLATEQGFPIWTALGTISRGGALAAQGEGAEGIAQMHQGLDAFQTTGGALLRPYGLTLLAEVYGKEGQAEAGLMVLAEAQALVDNAGGHWWQAELHRLKGELLLRQAVPDEHQAEICFSQALAIARRQQAKWAELRTAMCLSRLWQRQGKTEAARQLLAPIYGWFTEGFDTADLQEAKALLAALS
jgi:predicted ATPase/class 3 adenylate cyclase